jgi:flagella basal body P-ring formation protein FlgA
MKPRLFRPWGQARFSKVASMDTSLRPLPLAFAPSHAAARCAASVWGKVVCVLVLALVASAGLARAQSVELGAWSGGSALPEQLSEHLRLMALQSQRAPAEASAGQANGMPRLRFEVEVGSMDARLKLAPCRRVQAYVPPTSTLWGRSHVGLRCAEGVSPWNIFVPITVKAFGPALVAAAPLPLGRQIQAGDFILAEMDWAQSPAAIVAEPTQALGRVLNRAMAPGESLRVTHLKARQWFAAGDLIKVTAVGEGFAISSTAEALTPGIEGQPAKIRTESGRILTAQPTGEHLAEVGL